MDAYCINLKKDTERWEKINKNITDHNLNFNLIRINAIQCKLGHIGCFLSHQKIIKMAKKKKMKQILILEDDSFFHEKSYEIFQKVLEDLPEDWNVLVGGICWTRRIKKRVSPNLVKISDFSATQFILYRDNVYDQILSWKPVPPGQATIGDRRTDSIDRYIGWLAEHNILNVYCSVPFISLQKEEKSNTEENLIREDLEGWFKNAEKYLQKQPAPPL